METMTAIRQAYPQYDDLTDAQLMAGLYTKFYSDTPVMGFVKKLMTDYGFDQNKAKEFSAIVSGQGAKFAFPEAAPAVGGSTLGVTRGLVQGATLGAGDEIVAGGVAAARKAASALGLRGGDSRPIGDIYQRELERERQRLGTFKEDSPVLGYGSEVVGSMALPLGAASTIKGAAALGGGLGATSGFLTSEGDITDRLTGAATGGVLGALLGGTLQGAASGLTKQFEAYMTKRAAKAVSEGADSVATLRAEANKAYEAARAAGVQIDQQAYQKMLDDVMANVAGGAGRPVREALIPKSADVLTAMRDYAGKAVGLDDLEYLRQLAQTPAGMVTDKAEQRAASLIIDGIDDFIDSLDANKVLTNASDAVDAANALRSARNLWGRMRRTELISNIVDTAAAGGYAGGFESGLKTRIGQILRDPKLRRGFSEAELKLLSQIQLGTPIGRILAGISYTGLSTSGGRAGLLTAGGAGTLAGLLGGPWGAIIQLGGATALRAVREMSLEQQARMYTDILASGAADQVIKEMPALMRYLQSAAAAATRGAAPQLPSDVLSRK